MVVGWAMSDTDLSPPDDLDDILSPPPPPLTHDGFAANLRELADFIEAHPDIPMPVGEINIHVYVFTAEHLAEIARALGRAEKDHSGDYLHLVKPFGPIRLRYFTDRAKVCRRVVTGVRHVAETLLPARNEEIVEWVCDEPLLAMPREAVADPASHDIGGAR